MKTNKCQMGFRIPSWLRTEIRKEAAVSGRGIGEIITEALLARYSNGEGSFYAPATPLVTPPVAQPQGGR